VQRNERIEEIEKIKNRETKLILELIFTSYFSWCRTPWFCVPPPPATKPARTPGSRTFYVQLPNS